MNLKKRVLAAVAAVTLGWSVAANAEPNYQAAQFLYLQVIGEIHNHCVLLWTYDPNPYSNYGSCVFDQRYWWANVMQVSASMSMGSFYPDGTNVGETYSLVAQALWYQP